MRFRRKLSNSLVVLLLMLTTVFVGSTMATATLPKEYVAVEEAKAIIATDYRGKTIKVNVNDTSGAAFRKVQSAIDAIAVAPTSEAERITISITPGVYVEKVVVDKPYLTFINEAPAKGEVKITFNAGSGQPVQKGYEDRCNALTAWGTETTGTVAIGKSKNWASADASNFIAKDIIFENYYNVFQDLTKSGSGPEQTQACAIVTFSDKLIFDNCKFIGRQDTAYFKGAPARIYLKNCYIEGTVDYIFGDATAVFEGCTINSIARETGQAIYTAANTFLEDMGYIFIDCKLTADSYYGANSIQIKLGRPWQGDSSQPERGSHTAFINCTVTDQLFEEGWQLWGAETITQKIRYMEYGSKLADGTLVDTSKRLSWGQKLTPEQAAAYTPFNVLRSLRGTVDNWNPSNVVVDANTEVKATGIIITDSSYKTNLYTLTVPATMSKNDQGQPAQLQAQVLPKAAVNQEYTWSSADEKIAKVSATGLVTGIAPGKTQIIASTVDGGFQVAVDLTVASAPTAPPVFVKKAKLTSTGDIKSVYPKETLKVEYSYKVPEDNSNDCSLIQWYRVKADGTEEFIKQGTANVASAREYLVAYKDVGLKIKAMITPETSTSYGAVGEITTLVLSKEVKAPAGGIPQVYFDDNFDNLNNWVTLVDGVKSDNAFTSVDDPTNSADKVLTSFAPIRSVAALKPKQDFAAKNSVVEFHFRIRGGSGGFTVNDKIELISNYTENPDGTVKDGYAVIMERVSNGMSLAVSLGKYENGVYTYQAGVGAKADVVLGIPAATEHTRIQLDRTDNTMYKAILTVNGNRISFEVTELLSGKVVGNKSGVPVGKYYFVDRGDLLAPGSFIFKETVCKQDCLQIDNFYCEELLPSSKK